MISYDEALQQVIETLAPLAPEERFLPDAAGCVLADPAIARWDMPRCDNSAMDGFAVNGNAEGTNRSLKIIGASYAGSPFAGSVRAGQAVRITTGACLPPGTDTVIPLEEVAEEQGSVRPRATVARGQHVRRLGEEFRSGEALAAAGTRLGAGEVGLLASAGIDRIRVIPAPRAAVLATGDELVELGRAPGPGQIVNANLYYLQARLAECGIAADFLGIGADDSASLKQLLAKAQSADIIISTGGVSVGDKDLVHAALAGRSFRRVFWKVAIKPGKPLLFGTLAGSPFFGLPGNPAATAATFELFVKPALKRLAGREDVLPAKRSAILAAAVKGGGNRQAFLWSRLAWQSGGYRVTVASRQGSGQTRCLPGANALLPVPVGTEALPAGERVEVLLL